MKITSPLAALLTLFLATSAGAQITHTPVLRAGIHKQVVLAPGEVWSTQLRAPYGTRDVGLWFTGDLGEATAQFLAGDRKLEAWPLFEDHDLAPENFQVSALALRPAGAKSVTGLAHSYLGTADQVRLTFTGPATLTDLDLIWIAPSKARNQPAPDAQPLSSAYPKPPVSSRAAWGADPAQCSSNYCNTTHMAIHHTASSSDYAASTWSQAAANVKSIQSYHMYTNGWCDIGYNYLVTKEGWIFEGRGGGDNVKAAHDGFNCGSMGVASLGYFHTPVLNPPTTAQLGALEELGAWKCDQQGIDPLGSSWYAGLGAVAANVYGHRDVKATACPGDLLYAKVPQIRAGIDARLHPATSGGVLKGVLYDAALGAAFRLKGTVALADGTFVETGSDGYFEFALPSGTYSFAGTSSGHDAKHATESVTSGDVWESLGLSSSITSTHTNTSLGPDSFQSLFQGDPGSLVFLGYSTLPSVPTQSLGAAGNLWIDLATAAILPLGNIQGNGILLVNLVAPGIPPGTVIHTQGYLTWQGTARLTNGAAWRAE